MSWFDDMAETASRHVAKPWWFAACVVLVVVWAPSFLFIGDVDTWQLIINTTTTIVTFLMVALLQNTQDRTTRAIHHKLDALALGVAEVLDSSDHLDGDGQLADRLREIAGVELEGSP